MIRYIHLLAFSLLAVFGCAKIADYDIDEVASPEFLDEEVHEHHHEHAQVEVHDDEHDLEDTHTGLHHHDTGVRNHGTQWFFNQPWSASFVWGKMLRDSAVLLVLAAALFLFPRLKRKK